MWYQDPLPGMPGLQRGRPCGDAALPAETVAFKIIVTPWATGHTTVDTIVSRHRGGDHWNRRTGHLDLALTRGDLAGLSATDILGTLSRAHRR